MLARITRLLLAASVAATPLAAHAAPASAAVTSAASLESQFDRVLGTTPRAPKAVVLPRPAVATLPAPRADRFADLPRPTAAPRGDALEVQLASLANAAQGRIGVAALDLATGRTVSVQGDQPFPMASTSKIAIVAMFLAGVDQGKWSLSDRFPLMVPLPSAKLSTAVAPVRRGAELSALQLIELAISRSHNEATDALLAVVGGPAAVTRWVRNTTGIEEFRLDRDIATLVRDDGAVNPAITIDRRDSITPAAMVRLLAGLHQGHWLSRDSREVLLGAMSRCVTGRNRMRAMLPEGTAIAHKTGTLYNTASDVGFIETPDGRKLAVAIYVTGQGGKPGRESRIALLARTIYDGYSTERPLRAALR
ncbi:serine hydrolase [Novosphingobium piscinae]|uniref:Beta-lactamase n=1 Tax=Novosphingobium piscinae TaxID=1507448 RepID=A0A7X1FZP1_9SPHN|nr:serine hydrolase [Novosphingobium piscinae]MBC2669940.1 serine hydrolase [Novosphingobium piscinae]